MAQTGGAIRPLQFAVRIPVLVRHFGDLALLFAAGTAVPLAAEALWGRAEVTWRYALVATLCIVFGLAARRLPAAADMQRNEAIVLGALAFVVPPLLFSLPFQGYGIAWVDALFEATSAFTTTGLTTLDGVEGRPPTFLFARAWAQWTGGLGIAVIALAVLVEPGSLSRFAGFEARERDDVAGGARSHARKIAGAYLVLTLAGVAALWLSGAGGFDAVVHGLAAISTGGYSTHDDSIAGMGPLGVQTAAVTVGFLGAVSLRLYYRPEYRGLGGILREAQLWGLLAACGVLALYLVFVADWVADGAAPGAWARILMAVSAQTTTGFMPFDPGGFDQGSQVVMSAAMAVGGGLGSTAGGIKIIRLMILVRLAHLALQRASVARHGYVPFRLFGRAMAPQELQAAMAVAVGFAVAIGVSWVVFLAHGYPAVSSLFDVTSAVATVGLTSGVVGPGLEPSLKLLLCLDMVLGRVEVVALVVLILPSTWFGKRRNWS